MTTFAADISAWVAKAKGNADAVVRQSVQEMAYLIVAGSPVDTGFFRASWWACLNAVGENPNPPVKPEHARGGPHEHHHGKAAGHGTLQYADNLAALVDVIMAGKAGDIYYLLNNAAYAMPLEYGHSKQAPNGIVRPVVAAAPHIVDNVAAQLASGPVPGAP